MAGSCLNAELGSDRKLISQRKSPYTCQPYLLVLIYHVWTVSTARLCFSMSVHQEPPMPPKSLVFSKGQLYLQGCAYFNFSRHFLIHYAKIPFSPQPWKQEVKMDLSEIHDSCYCHRRESIPYLINHGHVLYHMQDCEKDV